MMAGHYSLPATSSSSSKSLYERHSGPYQNTRGGAWHSPNAVGDVLANNSVRSDNHQQRADLGVGSRSQAVKEHCGVEWRCDVGDRDYDRDSKLSSFFRHTNIKSYTNIHGVTIIPHCGDIVKVPADAIVTSEDTHHPIPLPSMVTRALLHADGGKCFSERRDKTLSCRHHILSGKICVTGMEDVSEFPFRYVLHAMMDLYIQEWTETLYNAFRSAVYKADTMKLRSVVMPLLGAGFAREDPTTVAHLAIAALKDVQPEHVKTVVIATLDRDSQAYLQTICESCITSPQDDPSKSQATGESGKSPEASCEGLQTSEDHQQCGQPSRRQRDMTVIGNKVVKHDANHSVKNKSMKQSDHDTDVKVEVTNKGGRFAMPSVDSGNEDEDDRNETDDVGEMTKRTARMDVSTDVDGRPTDAANSSQDNQDEEEQQHCPICMDEMTNPKTLDKCGHKFCKECIDQSFKSYKKVCPSCQMFYGVNIGNMPQGKMEYFIEKFPSVPDYRNCGIITIQYFFGEGTQKSEHPNPGKRYRGTHRVAFLPDNKEGRTVLSLLLLAFERRLTFTVGRSVTTGHDDVVIWNDIHHKTSVDGGPTSYGYPDKTYLSRVTEELASKGVTEDQLEKKHRDLKNSDTIHSRY